MSLPFFDRLHTCFPDQAVDIIAKDSSIHTVFLHHPGIRTIHRFSKTRIRGFFGLFRYGRALQSSGPYDMFISLPDSLSSAIIGYGTGSRIRAGYKAECRSIFLTHRFDRPRHVHQVHSYLSLLENLCKRLQQTGEPSCPPLACPPADSVTRITFRFSEQERQTQLLQRARPGAHIVLNVNSEAPSRRLPPRTWIELGTTLITQQHATLIFIGTPKERPCVEEVMREIPFKEQMIDFCGDASVRELAVLLRDADLLISNNSGPVHLANAVGTPVITFGGAAGRFETEPFNQNNARVINTHLPCSPCWKNVCRFPTVRCLEAITADEIVENAQALLPQT